MPMDQDVFQKLQAYVGREYIPGLYDCAHLARDVQRDLFGRHIPMPEHHPMGNAGQRRVINELRDDLAIKVPVRFDGCAALLYEPGSFAPIWHIGTVADHRNEPWILHNSEKLGSAHLHRLSDLQRWGMTLEAYYAWK